MLARIRANRPGLDRRLGDLAAGARPSPREQRDVAPHRSCDRAGQRDPAALRQHVRHRAVDVRQGISRAASIRQPPGRHFARLADAGHVRRRAVRHDRGRRIRNERSRCSERGSAGGPCRQRLHSGRRRSGQPAQRRGRDVVYYRQWRGRSDGVGIRGALQDQDHDDAVVEGHRCSRCGSDDGHRRLRRFHYRRDLHDPRRT
jgi:hypothetical protein